MALDLEALIRARSRELARALSRPMPPGRGGTLRRQEIEELRKDLLELIAMRRRLRQLAGVSGVATGARHCS